MLIDECNADVNTCDFQKRSPSYFAAGMDSLEILEALANRGADLEKPCANGDSPLLRACMKVNYKNTEFLIKKGLDVNFKGYAGNSAIHISRMRLDVFKLVLNSGGDLKLTNDVGQTAFIRACLVDNPEMVKFIHSKIIEKFENTSYLHDEVIKGALNSISFLRIKNLDYLIKFIESKETFNSKLKSALDANENPDSSLSYYINMNDPNDKKILRFHELFMNLIRYDFHPYPENPLFYVQKFLGFLNVTFLQKLFEYDILQEMREYLMKCIKEQLSSLMSYDRLNIFETNHLSLVTHFLSVEFSNKLEIIFNELRVSQISKKIDLKIMCRNQLRKSMNGLSENQIDKLSMPNQLKSLFFD